MNWDAVSIVALITAVGAIAMGLWQRPKLKAEADKYKSDAAETMTDTALKMIAPLKQEVADLRKELAEARDENSKMRNELSKVRNELADAKEENARHMNGIALLIHQVQAAGQTPIYVPKPKTGPLS